METTVLSLAKLIVRADIPQPPMSPEAMRSTTAILVLGLFVSSIVPISFVVIKTIKKKHSMTDSEHTE